MIKRTSILREYNSSHPLYENSLSSSSKKRVVPLKALSVSMNFVSSPEVIGTVYPHLINRILSKRRDVMDVNSVYKTKRKKNL
jgi:hypothetical protein